jgi:hypothetical protein
MRMDSGFWSAKTIKTCRRRQLHYCITVRQTAPIRQAIATIDEQAWVEIVYPEGGVAQVAETRYQGDRLVVRRTRLVGEQAELFPNWRYHAFVTDRVGTAVWLDADHRRHGVVELCIRDLKAGVGLRHHPWGKFAANAAWLLAATLAHNLLRWIAQIGLGARGELVVAKTLRRTLLALPGRITRSARRCTLHLPAGWPWAAWFQLALARLRSVAYATRPPPPDRASSHARSGQRQPDRARPASCLHPPDRLEPAAMASGSCFQHTHNPVQTGPASAPTRQEFRRRWIQAQPAPWPRRPRVPAGSRGCRRRSWAGA